MQQCDQLLLLRQPEDYPISRELARQRDDGRPVEEAPERIGDQRREPAALVVTDAAPATQTGRRENRRRAEGEVRKQRSEIRGTPSERLQVNREQIVDVRAEDVPDSGTGAPRCPIQQERRDPFPTDRRCCPPAGSASSGPQAARRPAPTPGGPAQVERLADAPGPPAAGKAAAVADDDPTSRTASDPGCRRRRTARTGRDTGVHRSR